jgi:protein MpaA
VPNYKKDFRIGSPFSLSQSGRGKIGGMKRFFRTSVTRFQSVPLPVRIGAGILLLTILYVWAFVIPTNVHFSYANKTTCANWFMLAPGIEQQRAGKDSYTVEPTHVTKLFGVPVFSTGVCVKPTTAPAEGRTKVSIAPYGLPVFSKTFGIDAPKVPTANVTALANKQISAVRPLKITLSDADAVHAYSIRKGDKTAPCASDGSTMSCRIADLELEPNTAYDLTVFRQYEKSEPAKLDTVSVRTLTAVQLVDATIKNDATVYDKPADFRLTFDRPLESAEGVLKRTDGSGGTVVATFKTDGKTVIMTPKQALPRNAAYQLTLEHVTGMDGASMAAPLVTAFKLSGGPKVASVSVGGSNVAQGARVIVTFDQALKADADIAKLARVTGVAGTVTKISDNSLAFALSSSPLCAPFSLVIDKGVPSGSNDETSTEPWKFDSRIVCGSVSTIGYSVKGRPITAYTFGSGSKTLLFTGGIHGTEASGATTMQALATYLQANAYKYPDKKVVVVPNTNPDGIAAGMRYNARNVNLDRNFPASNWRPDIDTASGTLPTGGGTSAGSEPETQALLKLTRQLRPRLEISFHAQGRLVGANQFGDSTALGLNYAKTVGYKSMIGNAEAEMGYSITGEYEDWIGQELGIPAILIELPSNYGNYLPSQMTALNALLAL